MSKTLRKWRKEYKALRLQGRWRAAYAVRYKIERHLELQKELKAA